MRPRTVACTRCEDGAARNSRGRAADVSPAAFPGYQAPMTAPRRWALGVLTALVTIGVAHPAAAAPLRFGTPVWVDRELAGGEPLVFADKTHHTLVYTSHEGTTHLYRPGLVSGATA